MSYLEQRKREYEGRLVGDVGGNFRYDRDRLIESVGKSAQRVVDTYNKSLEAQKIAQGAQEAVAGTALVEIGAVGLGAIVVALATTVAADVTGLVAASIMAALGLFVIPARRQAAKKEMAQKMGSLRQKLTDAITSQFDKELSRSLERINEAVAPYTRFVRAEQEKVQQTQTELNQAQQAQGRLRAEIETIL
jgi:hypothetical protein